MSWVGVSVDANVHVWHTPVLRWVVQYDHMLAAVHVVGLTRPASTPHNAWPRTPVEVSFLASLVARKHLAWLPGCDGARPFWQYNASTRSHSS